MVTLVTRARDSGLSGCGVTPGGGGKAGSKVDVEVFDVELCVAMVIIHKEDLITFVSMWLVEGWGSQMHIRQKNSKIRG